LQESFIYWYSVVFEFVPLVHEVGKFFPALANLFLYLRVIRNLFIKERLEVEPV
jgi:hypothetical protein